MNDTFLTAGWRHIAMLNYEVDPVVLHPYLSHGMEVDFFQGRTFISLVGFLFQDIRFLGIPAPFHSSFAEVNLRIYVRRNADEGVRRGVVFIKEIVPRRMVVLMARKIYGENYVHHPMRYSIERPGKVQYEWKVDGRWNGMRLTGPHDAREAEPGSEEEFISEHYWGYTPQPDGGTLEYRVDHPRWKLWHDCEAELDCDVERLYGPQFIDPLSRAPTSAFIADGSAVSVGKGVRLLRTNSIPR